MKPDCPVCGQRRKDDDPPWGDCRSCLNARVEGIQAHFMEAEIRNKVGLPDLRAIYSRILNHVHSLSLMTEEIGDDQIQSLEQEVGICVTRYDSIMSPTNTALKEMSEWIDLVIADREKRNQ